MRRKTSGKFIITLLILVLLSMNINLIGVTVAQVTHDVAVVSVTPHLTKVGLGLNDSANLTVVVENQGTEDENFTVTVSYGNETIQPTIIDTQNVINQAPNSNETLTFTWDTTGVTVGRYFFNATASFVSGETDTADNTFISPSDPKTLTANTIAVVSPYIAVLPRRLVNTTLTAGEYTVSIYTDYNGSDIWAYEFELTYNPSILNGTEVVNGDLITQGDVSFIAGDFNNTKGKLELTTAYTTAQTSQTGPGTLATVTFTIVGIGDSNIELSDDTRLKGVDGSDIIDNLSNLGVDPTEGKFLHGYFRNTEKEVVHDVAVISIDLSTNNVTEGEPVNINVTIKNNGTVTESATVEVYYGFSETVGVPLHSIEIQTTTIESGENKTLSFTWNTTGVQSGTHRIVAEVRLPETVTEENVDNNMLVDGTVEVSAIPGTPIPIELLVAIVVVVVAVIAIIYIVMRKRRK